MNLLASLSTIFLIISVGIVCYRKKIFSVENIEGFELLLFKIVMPSYLFLAVYKHNLSSLIYFRYIIAYLLTFGILGIIFKLFFTKNLSPITVCTRIMASGYINAGIYALPIITILFKDPTAAIISNIVQIIFIQPVFVAYLSLVSHQDKSLSKKILDIITTPLILMPITGILLNYFQIILPNVIIDAISQVSSGAPSLALFVFGLTLGATKITKECLKFDLLSIVFAKNILHPIIAIGVAYCMRLNGYWHSALLISASAPTAFVVYLISKQFSPEEELVKKAIGLSSVTAILSLLFIVAVTG